MTGVEFRAALAEFELHAPVTPEDLRAIYVDLKPRIPVGLTLDVVIRGVTAHDPGPPRVEVTIHAAGPAPVTECILIT